MKFILYTLLVGTAVAYFSVVSDNVPYVKDDFAIWHWVYYYLAMMINSLPVWFLIAMLTGRLFGKRPLASAAYGMVYTIYAITLYMFWGQLTTEQSHVSYTLSELLSILFSWYGTSLAGGIIGGFFGYYSRRSNWVWLPVMAGLLLQLWLYGIHSWQNPLGMAQNSTLVFMILFLIVYVYRKRKKHPSEDIESSG